MTEQRPEYLTDALEMIGASSVIVEPPRTVVARQNGRMVEVEEPAWVKFSTDFKKELPEMNEYALKAFIFIGLSINWHTGEAFPGIRKIAKGTGMDKDTAAKSVAWLEERGFLTIYKREGNSNIYKPTRYIAIGTVPPEGTPDSELSDEGEELSHENAELSHAQERILHNKNNKSKQDLLDAELHYHLRPKAIRDAMAEHFKLTPNWEGNKFNRQWMEWALESSVTPEQIKDAANLWRSDKRFNWQHPTLKGIQEHWLELSDKSEAHKTDELRPEYKPYIPPSDDGLVSNPFSRRK